MYKELLQYKNGYYFLFLAGITIFFTYWVQKVFVTDTVYYNTYSGMMASERIAELIQRIKSVIIFGYLILPVTIPGLFNSQEQKRQ